MYITVKVPLMDDHLTARKLQQLDQLTGRDTSVIHRYLEILQEEEEHLWKEGDEGLRIDKTKLDELTLTSRSLNRNGKQSFGRLHVKYDLKYEFGHRITVRELKECRDTAVEMWHGYRERLRDHEWIYWKILRIPKYEGREDELARMAHWWMSKKKPKPPCQAEDYQPKKLPRRATLGTTAFLQRRATHLTWHWLELYYSVEKGAKKHQCARIWLPLNCASYHLNGLQAGMPKTVQLVKQSENNRWYAHIAVELPPPNTDQRSKPLAVVALDLGMNKAVTAVLLTEDQGPRLIAKNIRIIEQKDKKRVINRLDNLIATLQHKRDTYLVKRGKNPKNVVRKLKQLSRKRHQLALQYDHELTAQIVQWVRQLEHRYTVYVAIGKLTGIRHTRRRGDGKSCKHRRELHRWAFARITGILQAKLKRAGLSSSRFRVVSEAWTSQTCSKCGATETHRPFQALVICHRCGAKLQADINGALNIGKKLICLLDEATLDHWLTNPFLETKYPDRSVRGAGRRPSCTRKASSTSSPRSGKETKLGSHVSVIQTQADHVLASANQRPGYGGGTRKLRTKETRDLASFS